MENNNLQQNSENNGSKLIRDLLMKKVFDNMEVLDYEKTQQPRTLQKKIDFVANLHRVSGNISIACKLTGIKSRKTIYNWMHDDSEFRSVIEDYNIIQDDLVEDALKFMVFVKRDGPSVRYYLSKRHPEYMKVKRITTLPKKKEGQWEKWERLWREQEEREIKELEYTGEDEGE